MDRRYIQTTDDFVADDLRQMQLASNYNFWLFSLAQPYLGRRIFEVGAGIGNLSRLLLNNAEFVFAIEPNPSCVAELQRTLGTHPHFDFRPWRIEDCGADQSVDGLLALHIDTIISVNVLEHIQDDLDALKTLAPLLQSGGRIVLIVPAVPWAYGTMDTAVGHFRRYARPQLAKLLGNAGFQIEVLKYSNLVGLAGWFYNARIKRIQQQINAQIGLFDKLTPWLARLEKICPPPIGMTLLAVGRKP